MKHNYSVARDSAEVHQRHKQYLINLLTVECGFDLGVLCEKLEIITRNYSSEALVPFE